MNTGQIRLWAWAAAGLITLGLSAYIFQFVRHLDEKSRVPNAAHATPIFANVKPPPLGTLDILSYARAEHLIALLDWTGAPKVVPIPPDPGAGAKIEVLSVKRLVIVLGVKQDLADRANSQVALKYRPEAAVTDPAIARFSLLAEGDRLAPPNDGVKIASITSERIVFTFDDVDRPPEEIAPVEFDSKSTIVIVGPDGVVQRPSGKSASSVDSPRAGRTIQLGTNRFRLGADDVREFGDHYAEILSQLETARHKDPRTGRYDGIEIKSVVPGSIAARHGAQSGDIIRSINGHPVSSNQEAIHFIKVNSSAFTSWEVVIENHGKTRTVTFESSN